MQFKVNPTVLMASVMHQLSSIAKAGKAFSGMKSTSSGNLRKPGVRHQTRKSIREDRNRRQHRLGRRNHRG